MYWILILTILGIDHPVTVIPEFQSEKACTAAGEAWAKQAKQRRINEEGVYYLCASLR